MNEKEINEYMELLLSGKTKVEGLEANALQLFHQLSEELEGSLRGLEKAKAEVEKLQSHILRVNGNREAFAQLLILAETERRKVQNSGLENLRKKLGADKLQLLDREKNVVDSAEG